jgi:hypothetical protein
MHKNNKHNWPVPILDILVKTMLNLLRQNAAKYISIFGSNIFELDRFTDNIIILKYMGNIFASNA